MEDSDHLRTTRTVVVHRKAARAKEVAVVKEDEGEVVERDRVNEEVGDEEEGKHEVGRLRLPRRHRLDLP